MNSVGLIIRRNTYSQAKLIHLNLAFELHPPTVAFAQKINANNMEIIVSERILICHCSDDDLAMVTQYGGEIKERELDQTTSAQRNN
jgi:hypothetical protein